nr:EFR1 family ferrodoxin [Tepiditoga spiralis]
MDFYYFSGTGNTYLIVEKAKKVFEKNNFKVNLYRLEKSNPKNIDVSHIIGLAFPVAVQSTYPFVWDFVKNFPNVENTDIFMLDTLEMFSGAVVGPMKRILLKKGFNPIGAYEFKMPSNFLSKKEINNKKIKGSLSQVETYISSIINNKSKWGRNPILSDLLYYLVSNKVVWKVISKYISPKVDENKCVSCGLCEKICPVNNITVDKYPVFNDSCQACMRCITYCPSDAISTKKNDKNFYKALPIQKIISGGVK